LIYLKQRAFGNPIYRKKEKTLLFQLTISTLCFEIPTLNYEGLLLYALVADVMVPFLAQLVKLYPRGSCVPLFAIYMISQSAMKQSPESPSQVKLFMKKWPRSLF
jgi:hypothetical protein